MVGIAAMVSTQQVAGATLFVLCHLQTGKRCVGSITRVVPPSVGNTTYLAGVVCTVPCVPYCIFNQDRRLVIILITSVSPGIYSFLCYCSCGDVRGGWGLGRSMAEGAERIHLKFAHLAVVRDMDSDSIQLAQSPPLSSLIFSWGI